MQISNRQTHIDRHDMATRNPSRNDIGIRGNHTESHSPRPQHDAKQVQKEQQETTNHELHHNIQNEKQITKHKHRMRRNFLNRRTYEGETKRHQVLIMQSGNRTLSIVSTNPEKLYLPWNKIDNYASIKEKQNTHCVNPRNTYRITKTTN